MPQAPSYRKRSLRGRTFAVVTLTDKISKKRRDFWLGEYDSSESHEKYARVVAEWEAAGRRLPAQQDETLTVTKLIHRYWFEGVTQQQYSASELHNHRLALRITRSVCGDVPAEDFGPNKLRLVRNQMVDRGWARMNVNRQVHRVRQMFKWAVSREILPVTVYQSLVTVESLRKGRTKAHECDPVKPAPQALIDGCKQHVSEQVAAMIDLQMLTGMRPGEVCIMRPTDIDQNGDVWLYRPHDHKTAHHDKDRVIYLGPRAQAIVSSFMGHKVDGYLFSPIEAEAARREAMHAARVTPLSCGNVPGTNRRWSPMRDRYDPNSYRRAVQRGCDAAFPPHPRLSRQRVAGKKGTRWETKQEWSARLGEDGWQRVKEWQRDHRFHPHQLRHNYATSIRQQFGIEAAQILLGHGSAIVTEVYAERDIKKATDVVMKVG